MAKSANDIFESKGLYHMIYQPNCASKYLWTLEVGLFPACPGLLFWILSLTSLSRAKYASSVHVDQDMAEKSMLEIKWIDE